MRERRFSPTSLAAAAAGLAWLLAVAAAPRPASAAGARKALFALIVGVNQSVDRDLPPLRYADDDAARYLDLFRLLGARTYLLARIDDNTRRLHPQAAAEATLPRHAELERAIAQVVADVAHARAQHVETVLYFIYAGHGNVDAGAGTGYVTLEDAHLGGRDIEALFERAHADEAHAIVDACYSYFLTFGRGPGGDRRAARGFAALEALGDKSAIGLLLSTSSARESHEWDAVQAGVFSHEVRSGLYGAADANGDGKVSYREIAAFIERANAAIPNERFRPDVFARAPPGHDDLVELSGAEDRRLEIDRKEHGHYLLEDESGVRLADFHNDANLDLRLLRPAGGRLYLRRARDDVEFEIPGAAPVIRLADLTPSPRRASERGAAHLAFDALFALPFNEDAVAGYVFRRPALPPRAPVARRAAALGAAAAAGVSLLAALALTLEAGHLRDGVLPTASQADAARANDRIGRYQLAGGILLGVGAAAGATATLLFLWPQRPQFSSESAMLGLQGVF